MTDRMTSMERTLTTLGFKEPDRVPLFLLATMHGARELDLSIQEYFSSSRYVIAGQLRLRKKYQSDCYSPFFYAAIETEAQGGDVIYRTDGPPNAGSPYIRTPEDIDAFSLPEIEHSLPLKKVLDTIRGLKDHAQDTVPIIGVVMSPFSIPVMQMGFERYLDLMYDQKDMFWKLMRKNEEFAVNWANAQLESGATAICYFDPVSSPTCVPPDFYRSTGKVIAQRTLRKIKGPTATHLASGLSLPILEDIAETGTAVVGVSALEDIVQVKKCCRDRLAILGNLNGIEMRNWSPAQAEAAVKDVILKAGTGGGFILSDNHGEIPWQVPESVLLAISEAARKWGTYPLVRTGTK